MLVGTCLFFAIVNLLLSLYVVITKNSVHALIALVGIFLFSALLWFLLQVEYLSIMLILVYVGAVMVLFLFVVMMVQPKIPDQASQHVSLKELFVFGAALIAPAFFMPSVTEFSRELPEGAFRVEQLGKTLFTAYLEPFLLIGLLLLTAMIAAVVLTFRGPRQRKVQHIESQVAASKQTRLKVISDKKD